MASELKRLGMAGRRRADGGGARFTGSMADAFRANLCLRCSDRVLLVLAEKEARSFEELFQLSLDSLG